MPDGEICYIIPMGDRTDRGAPSASSDAGVILIVHDDRVVRDRAAGMLADVGYAVVTASDDEEGRALARKLGHRLALVVVGSD